MRTPKIMVKRILFWMTITSLAGGVLANGDTPPETERVNHVDILHGKSVPDPYRWLEDLDSAKTKAWVKAQNEYTEKYLQKLPAHGPISKRLTNMWNYEKYSVPFSEGGLYFYFKNNGLQNQSVLYVMKSLDDKPRILLDPNKLSEDGTVALSGFNISRDGRYLAYGISKAGSDWNEWKVLEIESGKPLKDHVKWVKFSEATWDHDSKGFFYSRYDEPKAGEKMEGANYFQKLYYHKLGTDQSEDTLIYHRPDEKEWGFGSIVSNDGNYFLIHIWQGTAETNRLFYIDLKKDDQKVIELLPDNDASYNFIGNKGSKFLFQTNLDAPKNRVILIDLEKPEKEHWQEVIPQQEATLNAVSIVGGKLVCNYLKDASTQLKIYTLEGKPAGEIKLPGLGSASISGRHDSNEAFFSYSSFTNPGFTYRYDMESGNSTLFRKPQLQFDTSNFETTQVFYKSKDGTKIPMFLSHKKGLKLDGSNPTYLYGYGGFNVSLTPSFSLANILWMEMGGIFAQANLRGGGEYGRAWHRAGTKHNKQNVFDDFIAAAEYLIAKKYTSTPKLAIGGGSNGGLLVGACMAQRPDLFGAAIPAVGVMDMLRFHKFTIGWAWVSDYGSPDDPDMFNTLYAYSPYHNLKEGVEYPATLIMTSDHDDRVVPSHSYKFAAALQAAHIGKNPVLIRIESKAGHGAGTPVTKRIESIADRLSFLVENLGMATPKF